MTASVDDRDSWARFAIEQDDAVRVGSTIYLDVVDGIPMAPMNFDILPVLG